MRCAIGVASVLVALGGCGDGSAPQVVQKPVEEPAAVSQFDPAKTGTIAGVVRWNGEVPEVPAIAVDRFTPDGKAVEHLRFPNPHGPVVNDGCCASAVIFLRGVDASLARPWHHPPVTIEMKDGEPMVRQGDRAGLVGFVRRGDSVTMISRQAIFHAVRARGAAFFTLTLPDPDRERRRVLSQVGRVEFSSAAAQIAMRGHVFVDEHPYYTTTDPLGRFMLSDVPVGEYEVICWHPNWKIERFEHDPETLLNVRLYYRPPLEKQQTATVTAGGSAMIDFELGESETLAAERSER